MNQAAWEVALLSLCIWRESSNRPLAVQQAIGCSIRNRVNSPRWWGNSWSTVICLKYQYSSMTNPGDPNLVRWPLASDPSWIQCMGVAQEVYDGTLTDSTSGATNYYDDSIPPPDWAAKMDFTVQIATTLFYK